MTQRSRKGIIDVVLCTLLVSAQVPLTPAIAAPPTHTHTVASDWQTYQDPLYGYTLSIPAGWHVLPTPSDVVYGAAVFANYDIESAPGTEDSHALPKDAMRIQISVAPLAPEESTATWVARWQASQTGSDDAPLHAYHLARPAPLRIGPFETFSYAITAPSEPSEPAVTEVDLRLAPNQIAIAGITVSRADQLSEALAILSTLQPDRDLVFNRQASRLAQAWAADSPATPSDSADHSLLVTQPAQATPLSVEYTGAEAPNSPIELRMPFRAGERWIVGNVGSYYGEGYHTNSYSDYYATDWNRVDANDLGAVLLPVAAGTVVGADAPACPTTGFGCYVRVLHAEGIRTTYAHMSGVSITTGPVTQFDPIGLVGSTGNSTGPHLHLAFQQSTDSSYRSLCRNGGATCPNGETALSPQTPKPSPMFTASGPVNLVDGGAYTSADLPTTKYVFLPQMEHEPAPAYTCYHDPFDVNSLAHYELSGNVTWDESDESIKLEYAGDGTSLYATWVTSQSFTLSGRLEIPAGNIGSYDSVALAVRGAGAVYWATLAYGADLPQANNLSIMRNDVWGNLAPITLAPGWYTVQMEVDYAELTLRAKAWPDGSAEPCWQTSRVLDAGWTASAIGFRHFGLGTRADDLLVTEPYAPSAP